MEKIDLSNHWETMECYRGNSVAIRNTQKLQTRQNRVPSIADYIEKPTNRNLIHYLHV